MSRLLVSRTLPKFQVANVGFLRGRYAQARGYVVVPAISRSGLGAVPLRVGTAVRLGFSASANLDSRRGYAGPGGGGGGFPSFNMSMQPPKGEALKQYVSSSSGGVEGSAHHLLVRRVLI